MFNIPLPARPDLDQYKKRAKELLAAVKSGDLRELQAFAEAWFHALARIFAQSQPIHDVSERQLIEESATELRRVVKTEWERAGGEFRLANAQFVIAKLHGMPNWKTLVDDISERNRHDLSPFERAVDAIVSGDLNALVELLAQNPGLVRERSRREHEATLLHYISANGVEDYRQKTPPNAVAIARALLDAGAEVDALAETYGGGRGQTTMNLLVSSAHPHIAGLQGALAEVLLGYGAKIEGLDDDGSPIQTALAFGYIDTARTLHRRGARIGNITVAAALGRVDLVRDFVEGRGPELKASLAKLYWSGVGKTPKDRQRIALHWACAFGATDVVKYFLSLGMDPADVDDNKMSLIHNACSGPHMDIVRLLLARKVPLEGKNVWGGTVINSMLHFAYETPQSRPERILLFVECIEALIAAGSDLREVDYVLGIPEIDAVLDKHRPRPRD